MKRKLQFRMNFGKIEFCWSGLDKEFPNAREAVEWAEENKIDVDTAVRVGSRRYDYRDFSNDESMDAYILFLHPHLSVVETINIRERIKDKVKARNN